jgi:hypothetical protein
MAAPIIKGANITISIKGLALSYYNQKTKNWETKFLRHVLGHNLKVTVKKNEVVLDSFTIEKPDEQISIRTDNAKVVPSHYNEGNDNDFSHLVDFNSTEMCGTSFKFNNTPMTFLSTSDACFYSKTITNKPYTIRKNGSELFTRRLGLATGGDIVALDRTEITFHNSPDKNLTLLAEPDIIYEIIFDNDCPNPPEDGSSDFDRFSDVIESADKYTLTVPDVLGYMGPNGDPPSKEPPCTSGAGGG